MPADPISLRVESALRIAFTNLRTHLQSVLKDLKKDGSTIQSSAFNMSRLENTINSLRVQMEALGYRDAIRRQLEGIAELYQEVQNSGLKKQSGIPAEYVMPSEDMLRMLLTGAESELVSVEIRVADELSQILRRGVIGGSDHGDLLDTIVQKLNIHEYQAIALSRTTLGAAATSLTVNQGQRLGIKWYLYAGPDSPVNLREWCSHFVGRRVTLDMLNNHANDWGRGKQPNPPSLWLGGYNCRHRLVPLDEDDLAEYEAAT